LKKRQLDLGTLLGGALGGGAAVASNAPKSTVPEAQELKAEAWEGGKRVKIRYGPYRIPAISVLFTPIHSYDVNW
jgi:hypothetical protein